MWKSDLAVWLLGWPGVALSAALMLWNVCAGVKESRSWLAQKASERAMKASRLGNAGRLAQLGALALLLTGCGQSGATPLACGMGALLIITSLIGGEETAEAKGPEEGAEDMQTSAAEGTPAAKPRSITISHTPGQGITLHIDEGLRAAIAAGIKRDVSAWGEYGAAVIAALAESKDAPVVQQAIMEAVRKVVMGGSQEVASESRTMADEHPDLSAYKYLLRCELEELAQAEAAMQGPEDSRPHPEDVAVMRSKINFLRGSRSSGRMSSRRRQPRAPTLTAELMTSGTGQRPASRAPGLSRSKRSRMC